MRSLWLLLALMFVGCEHGPTASDGVSRRGSIHEDDDAGAGEDADAEDASLLEDVNGQLVDMTKSPVPNTKLVVAGQAVTTDEQGYFVVRDVPERYDVMLDPGDNYGRTIVYANLSTREPALQFLGVAAARNRKAFIRATAPDADSDTIRSGYIVESEGSWVGYLPDQGRDIQTRELCVSWADTETATAKVHAFRMQVDPETLLPIAYLGYAQRELTLSDSDEIDWAVTWEPMPFEVTRTELEVRTAAELKVQHAFLDVRFSKSQATSSSFRLVSITNPHVVLMLPKLPGAIFDFQPAAYAPHQRNTLVYAQATDITAEDAEKAVDIPFAAPTLTELASDAVLAPGLKLSWNNPLDLPSRVTLAPRNAPADAPMFEFFVRGSELTIPEAVGDRLPKDTSYALEVAVQSGSLLDEVEGLDSKRADGIYAYQNVGEIRTAKSAATK